MKSNVGKRILCGAVALALATVGMLTASAGAADTARTLEGRLGVTWICGDHEVNEPEYCLTDALGNEARLALGPQVGLTGLELNNLVGERVAVRVSPRARGLDLRGRVVPVVELAPLDEVGVARKDTRIAADIRGAKAYVTLLLRFADSTNVTPKPASYFTTLMSGSGPGLDNYFRTVSGNQVNLSGSKVIGWLNLPKKKIDYQLPDGSFDKTLALNDAIALAEGQEDFRQFYGINLAFNVRPFPGTVVGYGGRRTMTIQGTFRQWGVSWLGQHEQCVWAHELGHSLGLPNSSGLYQVPYDSKWDVMSQPFLGASGSLGKVAEGSIGFHYSLIGWIPAARTVEVKPNEQADASLSAISQLNVGTGPQLIRIPVNAEGTQFYTVEARRRVSYDATIPADGVVLHRVDMSRTDRLAQVVDATNDANPNDAGAVWTPGETFTDVANNVQIQVVSQTATGFRVFVSSGLLPPSDLLARGVSGNEVALAWKDNSANEAGFIVQRRTSGGAFADVAALASNAVSYSDKQVEARTTYGYRILAKGPSATTARSLETLITTGAGVTGKLSVGTLVNFGKVKLRRSKAKTLLIRNLSVSSALEVTVSGVVAPFSLAAGPLTFTVPAGGQKSLSVLFSPTAKRSFSGALILDTSDPAKPRTPVRLQGKGKK